LNFAHLNPQAAGKFHCAQLQAVLGLAQVSDSAGGAMDNVVERRAARRFSMMLPLKVRFTAGDDVTEKDGETRDVSFRGLYFLIEPSTPDTGSSIEFVLTLPQQITLAGDVHIRCYARVLRVEPHNGRRGVAARIERYEFLPASA
jgi:PilZ domain